MAREHARFEVLRTRTHFSTATIRFRRTTVNVIPGSPDIHHPLQAIGGDRQPGNDGTCTVSAVSTLSALETLETTWNVLLAESEATVFQTFEWVRSWWTHYGGGRSLHCLVFECDGSVVGIAPLFCEQIKLMHLRIARRLLFIGWPESDYNDMIIRRGSEELVLRAFASHLAATADQWDVLDMEDVPQESVLAKVLPGMLQQQGIEAYIMPGTVCPQIELPSSFELFLQGLGPNTRYNIKRKKARLMARCRVDERVLRNEADDIDSGVKQFITVHGNRWKNLGFPSAYDEECHRGFLLDVARRFARRGWLRIFLLSADGQPVAASIEFNYRRRMYMYQSNAYGPEHVMRNSPGLLVKVTAIEQGIAEEMQVYDLLRGTEAYKYDQFKATQKHNWTMRFTPRPSGVRGRYLMFITWALARKIKGRVPLEFHEFKRFAITKRPSLLARAQYLMLRVPVLLRLGRRYIVHFIFRREDSTVPR